MKERINGSGIYYYGYQWWLGRSFVNSREFKWVAGFGFGGQRLFIQPDLDLVVAINSGHYGGPFSSLQGIIPLAIFSELVLRAVKN